MSSTNSTLTIGLSQYVGTDKPTYLSDYNSDMLKIDNAIAADRDSIATAQSKADGADAKADANAGAISDLDTEVNNASNGLVKRVTDVEGDVNTIESLIGNGTPTTTDKTIIGAINELDSEIEGQSESISSVNGKVGNLDNLHTTDKSNIVNAINEIVSSGAGEGTIGTEIDLSSYTSQATAYTTPSDGYVFLYTYGGDTSYISTTFMNTFLYAAQPASSVDARACYVKKGTVLWATLGTNSQAKFYPYEYSNS